MTREEFIKILNKKKYSYEMEGNEILVTHQENLYLSSLESLPPGVRFQNQGDVRLDSLKSLPPGVQFQNQGNVLLRSLMGGWFYEWNGNIKGVDSKRLLNLMIDKSLFV